MTILLCMVLLAHYALASPFPDSLDGKLTDIGDTFAAYPNRVDIKVVTEPHYVGVTYGQDFYDLVYNNLWQQCGWGGVLDCKADYNPPVPIMYSNNGHNATANLRIHLAAPPFYTTKARTDDARKKEILPLVIETLADLNMLQTTDIEGNCYRKTLTDPNSGTTLTGRFCNVAAKIRISSHDMNADFAMAVDFAGAAERGPGLDVPAINTTFRNYFQRDNVKARFAQEMKTDAEKIEFRVSQWDGTTYVVPEIIGSNG